LTDRLQECQNDLQKLQSDLMYQLDDEEKKNLNIVQKLRDVENNNYDKDVILLFI